MDKKSFITLGLGSCDICGEQNISFINETSGRYYKPVTIVSDDSRVVNKLEASLTDDARVIIYNRHMFIVQATNGMKCGQDWKV